MSQSRSALTHKALREKRIANKQCVCCGVPWPYGKTCEWCKINLAKANRKYRRSKNGKTKRRVAHARYQRSDKGKATRRRYVLKKRIAGECRMCSQPCADGSDFCAPHRDIVRAQDREAKRLKYIPVALRNSSKRSA